MRHFLLILLWLALGKVYAQALPETQLGVGSRHILIVTSDGTWVRGSYYFAVINQGSAPAVFKAPLLLPQETENFMAIEGVKAEELVLASDGAVSLERAFAPGMNLLGVGFEYRIQGSANLTLIPKTDLGELSIAAPDEAQLRFSAVGLMAGVPAMLSGKAYSGIISDAPVAAGTKISVQILGLPEGRRSFWILGAGFALLLLGLSTALALATRPSWKGVPS